MLHSRIAYLNHRCDLKDSQLWPCASPPDWMDKKEKRFHVAKRPYFCTICNTRVESRSWHCICL